MTAIYYTAETEAGDHIDDPSEDALFVLLEGLDHADNTFVTLSPVDGSHWYAVASLLDEGGYEVEFRDPARHEHELTTVNDISAIANDLVRWLGERRISR